MDGVLPDPDEWQGVISIDVELALPATTGRTEPSVERDGSRLAGEIKRRLGDAPYPDESGVRVGNVTMSGSRDESWVLMEKFPWDEADSAPVDPADDAATTRAREAVSSDLVELMASCDRLHQAFPDEPAFARALEDLGRAKDSLGSPEAR